MTPAEILKNKAKQWEQIETVVSYISSIETSSDIVSVPKAKIVELRNLLGIKASA